MTNVTIAKDKVGTDELVSLKAKYGVVSESQATITLAVPLNEEADALSQQYESLESMNE